MDTTKENKLCNERIGISTTTLRKWEEELESELFDVIKRHRIKTGHFNELIVYFKSTTNADKPIKAKFFISADKFFINPD